MELRCVLLIYRQRFSSGLAIEIYSINMHFMMKAGMRPNDCARSWARYAARAVMLR